MKQCSSGASTSSEDGLRKEEDKDSGICSLYCLASCLNTASNFAENSDTDSSELSHLLAPSAHLKPFLRRSNFSNVPPTINFYTKGHKVKKPTSKFTSRLTWCHNSLLPLVIRQSLAASHFKIVDESKTWFGYWGRHLKSAQYKQIKPYQKVNHFPGAFHLGRKDRLWQHLSEMMDLFDDDTYCIMPHTYVLPKDAKRLRAYLSIPTIRHVILKPPASARGTGISIESRFSAIPSKTSLIAQHYIETPLLINGSKFDLRLYVYVTSLDPLRVYIYEKGLVRFASVPYSSSLASYSNQYMHLTNYSINKTAHENAGVEEPVPKWALSEFWTYLEKQGYDSEGLKTDIKSLALKAITACEKHIREHQAEHSDHPFVSHELFGMDVLIDTCLRPWLIEMNISPSLHSATPIDVEVKAPLAKDVLNMCGLSFPLSQDDFNISMSYRTKHYHRHKSVEHIEKEKEHLLYFVENNTIREDILESLTDADVRCLVEFEDEYVRRGNFELIFPLGKPTENYLTHSRSPTYFNLLLSEWQNFQRPNRQKGIDILELKCFSGYHIAKNCLRSESVSSNDSKEESGVESRGAIKDETEDSEEAIPLSTKRNFDDI
ncbi:tubulin-tyrosine ligase family domain-containing protein [Ditylenchus destructor]|nr:tubulin-tyrosine ligase family domain-containing protein [Ditylenchus destructor]